MGCETQQDIDELWAKLTADGGAPSRCGWLKDKFGLSWQIVPNALGRMLGDADPAKAGRVMSAMLQMDKLDLNRLELAHKGEDDSSVDRLEPGAASTGTPNSAGKIVPAGP